MTSQARRDALTEYLRVLRDAMRLQSWDVSVTDKAPSLGDRTILEVVPHEARHNASVRIGRFFDQPVDEQRQTAVHELIHLVQAHLWEWVDDDQPWHARIAEDLREELKQRIHYELEVQADFLARLIAPAMPMPPEWPDATVTDAASS